MTNEGTPPRLGLATVSVQEQHQALVRAAGAGDTLAIRRLLDAGAPTERPGPLGQAAAEGHAAAVRILAAAGMPIDGATLESLDPQRNGKACLLALTAARTIPRDALEQAMPLWITRGSTEHAGNAGERSDGAMVALAAACGARVGEPTVHAAIASGNAETVAAVLTNANDPDEAARQVTGGIVTGAGTMRNDALEWTLGWLEDRDTPADAHTLAAALRQALSGDMTARATENARTLAERLAAAAGVRRRHANAEEAE